MSRSQPLIDGRYEDSGDHTHADVGCWCSIDFREPSTGELVYYSNTKWGRTLDDPRREAIAEMNRAFFT